MIKRLMQCIGAYKKDSILTPVYIALEVLMETLIPFLMAELIDNGVTGGNMNIVLKLGLILIFSALISLTFATLAGRAAARASAGFAKNIRHTMYYNIQNFSFANIDHFSTSGLVTRLTTDVTNVQNAYQLIIRTAVRSPLTMIFSIAMVYRLNSSLSAIFLLVIPILLIGLCFIMTHAHPIFTRVFKLYDKLNTVVQENLRGIRVVKSYVREDQEIQKFENTSGEIFSNFVRAEKLLAFNAPLMQFCMYTCSLLICWLGAQMIVSETLTTGQLMSILTYSMQALMSLMMLSMVFVMITMSRASAQRIYEVLEEKSSLANCENPVYEIKDGSISFDGVSFGYRGADGKQCLQDITLSIPSGQTVGIIGGTGSGKSSLTQLIPRLYDVTAGEIKIGGINVKQYDLETLRSEVAMVLQKNVLFSGTIKDNLRWGKEDATDEELTAVCQFAQAHDFISTFPHGYDTWIEQGGSNVSGGQKQRLCIARALLRNPKILILDDSTSAVDTRTDALIRKALRESIPETTKIIIAQRITSIQDADQIIVMDDGRIDAVGTHETLLETNQIYREVYHSQQKGGLDDDAA